MNLITPAPALLYGFVNETTGTHGSRTMMLKELRLLFAACRRPTTYEQFRAAIVGDNALLKSTETTRRESFRRLRELYGLDEAILLFRGLRDLWEQDTAAWPLQACSSRFGSSLLFVATGQAALEATP